MFLFTNPLWKICMKYLHVSLWLDDSRTKLAAQFGEAFSYKTMKNNKYLCQNILPNCLEQQKHLCCLKTSI